MNFLEKQLNQLKRNARQYEAYNWDSHCVVLAGPGSGKTALLTMKIMKIIAGKVVPPRGLACVTFNNEAVREFKNRLRKLGLVTRQNIFLGTVHSFCLQCVLKIFGKLCCPDLPLNVASDRIRKNVLEEAMAENVVIESMQTFPNRFEEYRRTHLDRSDPSWLGDNSQMASTIEYYEHKLHERGYIDFEDIIFWALKLIETYPFVRQCLSCRFPYLLIDEYQDLGLSLHRIILSLMENTSITIFAVGDPDQSIYGYTGADPKYLVALSRRSNVHRVQLELNYRCGQHIIDGAEIVLAPPVPRNYQSAREGDQKGEINFIEERGGFDRQLNAITTQIIPQLIKVGIKPREITILYIDKYDGAKISRSLNESGIEFTGEKDLRYPRTFITRWLEDVAGWCCGNRGEDGIRFEDIFNFWINLQGNTGLYLPEERLLPKLKLFSDSLANLRNPSTYLRDWLHQLDQKLNLKELLSAQVYSPEDLDSFEILANKCQLGNKLGEFKLADFAGCGVNANRLSLHTLHSSKGLQFDAVIMPGLEDGRLPRYDATTNRALNESRRLFYVGITRARDFVFLLYSGWYNLPSGRRMESEPSRFVIELHTRLEQ